MPKLFKQGQMNVIMGYARSRELYQNLEAKDSSWNIAANLALSFPKIIFNMYHFAFFVNVDVCISIFYVRI